MEIIVYTKPDCDLCASFKDKLRSHLKVPFGERDLKTSLQVSDHWREDRTDRLAAAQAYLDGAVPLVLIDRSAYDYTGALMEIKRRLEAGEEATMPEPERDKSLDKRGPRLTEAEFVAAVWRLCANHIGGFTLTSSVERAYDSVGQPPARREVQGVVEAWVHYRDPSAKPMCVLGLTFKGQNFREALRNLRDKTERAKQGGHIWTGKRGVPDGAARQAGGDRGEEKRPDGA